MTKPRVADTVEDALDQAVGVVGADAVAHWIGKSADWVRKCSDPDNERQLSMRDALAIDRALAHAGHLPVFAELVGRAAAVAVQEHRNAEAACTALRVEPEKPLPAAIRVVGEATNLLEQVQAAEADGAVDPRELSGLLSKMEKLCKLLPKLRRSLFARQKPATGKRR